MSSGASPADAEIPLAELAKRYGLRRVGARPPLGTYVAQLWHRRHFVTELARARAYSRNQNNYLGQLWLVLNPLLLAGVYYLVFGLLLGARGDLENYVGFLVVGIFMFQSIGSAVNSGSNSISGNLQMVRALKFPRAALPIAVTIAELIALVPMLVVMFAIVLVTGERPTWGWLLVPVAVLLTFLFNVGCAFVAARIVVAARDLRNLIPLAVRLLRYVSGVFFSISALTDGLLGTVLQYQPVAVYLDLVRACLLAEVTHDPTLWAAGAAWAVVFLVIGFLVFWSAEERYGRD